MERHIVDGITEPHNAASVAMKEVAGAVIATSLVLVAVFVPVALFPGTTGILFRQFALTIAFSVSISAFNALTLTPALFNSAIKWKRRFVSVSVKDEVGSSMTMMRALVESALAISTSCCWAMERALREVHGGRLRPTFSR